LGCLTQLELLKPGETMVSIPLSLLTDKTTGNIAKSKHLAVIGCAAPAPAPAPSPPPAPPEKPIEISMMHYMPATHFVQTEMYEPWAKMLEENTGGRVKVTIYPAAALAKPPDFFDAMIAGTVDSALHYSGYTPGRFPISDVSGLPFLGVTPSAKAATLAFMDIYNQFPEIQDEWKEVKVLFFLTHSQMQLFTSKVPVRTLDDLKGLKIKISGRPAPYLEALGATPIAMASPEVYDAIDKGVIDGCIYPWTEVYGAWRLDEVCPYHTELNFYTMPWVVGMNWDKWNSLPKDIQDEIEKISGYYGAEMFANAWDAEDEANLKRLKEDPNMEYITLPESELAKAKELVKPFYDEWLADMEKRGIDGQAILDALKKALAERSK